MGPVDYGLVGAGRVLAAAGAWPLARAVWRRRRAPTPSCPWCGYHLGGLVGSGGGVPACPECGRRARGGRGLRWRPRVWSVARALRVVIAGALAIGLGSVGTEGRWRLVPEPVLIWMMPYVPPAWDSGLTEYLIRLEHAASTEERRVAIVKAALLTDLRRHPDDEPRALNAAWLALHVNPKAAWPRNSGLYSFDGLLVSTEEFLRLLADPSFRREEREGLIDAVCRHCIVLTRDGFAGTPVMLGRLDERLKSGILEGLLDRPRMRVMGAEESSWRLDTAISVGEGQQLCAWDVCVLAARKADPALSREALSRLRRWWAEGSQRRPQKFVPPGGPNVADLETRLASPYAKERQWACDEVFRLGVGALNFWIR